MLDYIVDQRRCERSEVKYYKTHTFKQMTARQFVKHKHYKKLFEDPDALESLRYYMKMSMLLKLSSIPFRQNIMQHPMWQVRFYKVTINLL